MPIPPQPSLLDKEVHIRIRSRTILHSVILILLLVSAFFAGRMSVDNSTITTIEEVEEVEESSSFSLTGFLTSLLPDFSETAESTVEEQETTPTQDSPENTSSSAETVAEPATNTTVTEPEEPAETVITTYSKVAVSLNDVIEEWKETWGKITKIDFTIKNNEAGTVQPDYFIMHVEGYDDIDKKIPLPPSAKNIKAGQSYSLVINIPQGFAYNPVTAGDLSNVRIGLSLYDASDKLMGSFSQEFSLQSS